MSPLDAWHIISANLAHLYKMRRTACYRGYVDVDTEAEVIAFKALDEMNQREKNPPLKPKELKQMEGEPVWVHIINKSNFANPQDAFDAWGLVRKTWVRVWDKDRADLISIDYHFEDYDKDWLAYRYKPSDIQKNLA